MEEFHNFYEKLIINRDHVFDETFHRAVFIFGFVNTGTLIINILKTVNSN